MKKILMVSILSGVANFPAFAFDTTQKGKILFTEGHVAANCKTVGFRENGTGVTKVFRIQNVDTADDVSAVVLSALIASRDVTISYEPTVTTGCGPEPRILVIRVY